MVFASGGLLGSRPHLEDVVLDGATELCLGNSLLLGSHNIHGQHRKHSAIHGHGDRHFVQRNPYPAHQAGSAQGAAAAPRTGNPAGHLPIKKPLHVFNRVDGHAGHTNVSNHPFVVRIVAAKTKPRSEATQSFHATHHARRLPTMRGEIKRHAQALLTSSQILSIEGVALLHRGKAGILANGPRPCPAKRRAVGPSPQKCHEQAQNKLTVACTWSRKAPV